MLKPYFKKTSLQRNMKQ